MTVTIATLACTGASKCAGKLTHVVSSDAAWVPYGEKSVKVNLFYFWPWILRIFRMSF